MKKRSTCPAACALDLAGDKWTLLVVRDLLRGRNTYGALAASDEGIPTNILADRLRKMEEAGLIEARPYQERPVRYAYSLTGKGPRPGRRACRGGALGEEAHPRYPDPARVQAGREAGKGLNQACQTQFDSLEFTP